MADTVSIAAIRKRALAALRPPAKIRLSDWTESHVRLPSSLSAQPGLMRLWPHQRAIADSIGDPGVERVSILKSARVGYTQLLTAATGNFVANDPCPILVVLPAEQDCRSLMVNNLEPVFNESPALRGALTDTRGRDVLLERHFPGGSLKLVSARAPRNLRGHTARVLFLDEVDAFEVDVRGEGDPVNLAIRRTTTYADRKIVMGSTPVHEETSKIVRAYAQSDQRVFEVPCPQCGERFELEWSHIAWEEGQPDTAHAVCPNSGCVIEEREKSSMVENGAWRATRPDVKGHHGYRLNSLVSLLPNARWSVLAAEFIEAKKSPETLQTFVNTVLGQPWRDQANGEGLDEGALASRAEPFSLDAIPPEVSILTAGVDVQRDRLECVILGWSESECFVMAQREIWGSPHENETWADLDDYLKTIWRRPDGSTIRISATAVDAGDGETMDKVMEFCRARLARRVFAVKGAAGQRAVIAASKSKGGRLFIVGVDGVKSQIMARLTGNSVSVRFSASLEARFYEELTSERLVVKYSRGAPVRQWERIAGRRAEALDCIVYGWAVRALLGGARPANTTGQSEKPRQAIKSRWLDSN